jgi:hypothetical protein
MFAVYRTPKENNSETETLSMWRSPARAVVLSFCHRVVVKYDTKEKITSKADASFSSTELHPNRQRS